MAQWRNWSGSVRARPAALARPRTNEDLQRIVAGARRVRVVGAGHSFMPLCETDGVLVSLADLEGALRLNAEKTRAWAPAGWSLAKLTEALWKRGVSLINQGDVDPQTLAGAIATGTHGTGAKLGSLSTAARAFKLMLASGEIVQCSAAERPELFQAQRLSLGLTGIALEIEIDVLHAYHLVERIESHPVDAVEERWAELAAENRHAEFFVFPYCDQVILKTLNPAEGEGPLQKKTDMDETAFRLLCEACTLFPALTPRLQRGIVRAGVRQRRVGPAYQIFPSTRTVRFEEMEYEAPRAVGWGALREAIGWIKRKQLPVTFPFEFRTVAGDDIWLSPMHAGPCVSISMHQFAKMPWRDLFAQAEPIFRDYGGRPHWAKRHSLTARDVEALYPDAAQFKTVRARHDPEAKFANAHLRALFEVEA